MPKQRSSKKSTTTFSASVSTSASAASEHQPTTLLRRSPRLLQLKPTGGNTHKSKPTNNGRDRSQREPKKPDQTNETSSVGEISISGSKRYSSMSNRVKPISSPRRSPRFATPCSPRKSGDDKTKRKLVNCRSQISTRSKRDLLNGVRGQLGRDCWKENMARKEKKDDKVSVGIEVISGLKATGGGEFRADKKRKRGEQCNVGNTRQWTREQELALRQAYFSAKPTPSFWKKVSKLVPGKSAQECFDKIHSDHMTPQQTVPRSRANRTSSSPLAISLLSANKLLNPSELKFKRLNFTRRKNGLAQKNIRKLLQKHNQLDQDHEADLFSIFEPNMNPFTLDSPLNVAPCTPKDSQEREGVLHKCDDRSSSHHKRPLSRFSGSLGKGVISPPVLKQVKNRALHERYIDQLHCREAKRKSARVRKGCTRGKENTAQDNVQELDVVRTAKNALVSHARDAVNQLKHLQTSASSNSSDFDNDGFSSNSDTIEDQS